MKKLSLLVWILSLMLIGCGQNTVSGVLSGADTGTLTLQGPAGEQITLPTTSLSRLAQLRVSQPSSLPILRLATSLTAVRLNLGGAEVRGPIQFSLPSPLIQAGDYLAAVYEGSSVLVPLLSQNRQGRLEATLDVASEGLLGLLGDPGGDGRDLTVILVHPQALPPHQFWSGYNGYQINSDGSLRQFVTQGVVSDTLPSLGAHPVMLVHGLGDQIQGDPRWPALGQRLLQGGQATEVVAFEYDSQDSIAKTGQFLSQYYALLNHPGPWGHAAHSMGTLVSRSAFETNNPFQPVAGSKAMLLCGPHLGSAAIDVLRGSLPLSERILRYLILNDVMTFRNPDGSASQVDVNNPGFANLSSNSPFLQALNANADQHHPNVSYATLGGNAPGLKFTILDDLIGVQLDDGLVSLPSANFAGLGQVQSLVAPVNHSSALEEDSSLTPLANFIQ